MSLASRLVVEASQPPPPHSHGLSHGHWESISCPVRRAPRASAADSLRHARCKAQMLTRKRGATQMSCFETRTREKRSDLSPIRWSLHFRLRSAPVSPFILGLGARRSSLPLIREEPLPSVRLRFSVQRGSRRCLLTLQADRKRANAASKHNKKREKIDTLHNYIS